MSIQSIQNLSVTPGTRVLNLSQLSINNLELGNGIYEKDGNLYASLVGTIQVEKINDKHKIEIKSKRNMDCLLVPDIGSLVIGRVLRVSPFLAKISILCVNGKALRNEYPGVIRQQDVRLTEIDKVVMGDCFRPGDIVQAAVISLGDQRNYYLSTAKNELGVIYAKSANGGVMIPVNWNTMQCLTTGIREPRKVAKFNIQEIVEKSSQDNE